MSNFCGLGKLEQPQRHKLIRALDSRHPKLARNIHDDTGNDDVHDSMACMVLLMVAQTIKNNPNVDRHS